MTLAFTKLFSSILQSTIWVESVDTRILWITMLALADRHGRVHASIPGLARTAGIAIDKCEQALGRFLSPDTYSRTDIDEGRRIREIDGGWELVNYIKYREMKDEETAKEAKRRYINKRRAQERQNVTLRANHVSLESPSITHRGNGESVDRDVEK